MTTPIVIETTTRTAADRDDFLQVVAVRPAAPSAAVEPTAAQRMLLAE